MAGTTTRTWFMPVSATSARSSASSVRELRERHGDRHRDGTDLAEAGRLPRLSDLLRRKSGGRWPEGGQLQLDGRILAGRLAVAHRGRVERDDRACGRP